MKTPQNEKRLPIIDVYGIPQPLLRSTLDGIKDVSVSYQEIQPNAEILKEAGLRKTDIILFAGDINNWEEQHENIRRFRERFKSIRLYCICSSKTVPQSILEDESMIDAVFPRRILVETPAVLHSILCQASAPPPTSTNSGSTTNRFFRIICNKYGIVKKWDPALSHITSIPPDQIPGLHLCQITHSSLWKLYLMMCIMNTEELPMYQGQCILGSYGLLLQSEVELKRQKENGDIEINLFLVEAKPKGYDPLVLNSAFVAALSHDINTPMNAIIGFSDLLEESPLTVEQQNYVQIIRDNIKEILNQSKNLIDLARISVTSLELNLKPVKIPEMIAQIVGFYKSSHPQVLINAESPKQESFRTTAFIDEDEVKGIISNLISTLSGLAEQVYLSIGWSIFPVEEHVGNLEIDILCQSDMPLQNRNMVACLRAFHAGDKKQIGRLGSIGLSLLISQRLSELMGAKLDVIESEESHCKVRFSTRAVIQKASVASEPTIQGKQEIASIYPLRILVVEDDPMNQLLMRRILLRMGYQCSLANNGAEALRLLKQSRYDLILMDIQMPVMDGISATTAIRKGEAGDENRSVFISAVTAFTMSCDQRKCFDAGVNDYMSKPINPEKLRDLLISSYHKITI
ncbi:MAG: response regulator [Opitutales bacterium]|nr:response regulator [Opitutales bacterium]